MKILKARIEIGNTNSTYHLYIDNKIHDTDLSKEELNDSLKDMRQNYDMTICLVETSETDNGVDYMWNLVVDGFPMYVSIPWEFADAIIDALLYRRGEEDK